MASFEKSQAIVGINEGGYQDDPADSGNWYMGKLIGTNWGIAAPTLAAYLGRTPSAQDMKTLPRATAEHILKKNFWDKNNFGKIRNQSVATMLYDGAVNHGVSGMRQLAVKALATLRKSVEYHNVFTLGGIELMNKLNSKDLFYALKQVRSNRYKSSAQKKFINGWLNRLERIKYEPDSNLPSGVIMYSALFVLGISLLLIGL